MKEYRIRTICLLLTLLLSVGFLSGYKTVADTKYFSVYWDTEHVIVSEKSLRANWFYAESRKKFSKNRTIYERISELDNSGSYEKQLEKHLPEIYQVVEKLSSRIDIKSFDGDIQFDPSGHRKFWVTDSRDGRQLNKEQLCKDIISTLQTRKYTDIAASIEVTHPQSEEEVLSKIKLKSSYTTYFDRGNEDRSSNIALALCSFNGKVVHSGQQVSFNNTVGPRTAARGYEEANIIIDGEFVPGIGGGVCQASTTVFNAVLFAGLKIIESHNHSLPISYVPLGRDAMVSSAADLVFVNDSGSPIYIEAGASVSQGKAVVKIYGAAVEGLEYRPRVESKTLPIEKEIEGTIPSDLARNEHLYKKIIVEEGSSAREALTYIEIYKGEFLVNSKLIRKSRYKGKKRIVRYEKIEIPVDILNSAVI